MPVFDDEMLTIRDLAEYLKVRPQTIYRWVQNGTIPGTKFGKEWRFRKSLIEAWIEARTSGGSGRSASKKSAASEKSKKRKKRGRKAPEHPGDSSASKN